jgi:hypothetical protein
MARRLLAFALALGLAGAPVASEICRTLCANDSGDPVASQGVASHHQHSADNQAQDSHRHHSAAQAGPLSTGAAMQPVTHACRELISIVVESRESVRAPVATGILPTTGLAILSVQALPAADVDGRHGPPGAIRSIAPLRI